MPNPYFQFKQFMIYQDKCAMKVGTDGVLLGAWVDVSNVNSVLDIGTGTGLISLMINQRLNSNVSIDAIDIDDNAILQAKDNIYREGLSNIRCVHNSLQSYVKVCDKKYSLIVSNPPYFSLSLHSPDKRRTLARHTDTLQIDSLLEMSADLLTDNGRIALIYPFSEKESVVNTANRVGLYVSRITDVCPTPLSKPKRVLLEFSKIQQEVKFSQLIIETERHVYSPEFTEIVKDFYLKL